MGTPRLALLAFSVLTLLTAFACSEREEYKGTGSRGLVDPSADGSVVVSSSGGVDAAGDVSIEASTSDASIDGPVTDTGSDAKEGG